MTRVDDPCPPTPTHPPPPHHPTQARGGRGCVGGWGRARTVTASSAPSCVRLRYHRPPKQRPTPPPPIKPRAAPASRSERSRTAPYSTIQNPRRQHGPEGLKPIQHLAAGLKRPYQRRGRARGRQRRRRRSPRHRRDRRPKKRIDIAAEDHPHGAKPRKDQAREHHPAGAPWPRIRDPNRGAEQRHQRDTAPVEMDR